MNIIKKIYNIFKNMFYKKAEIVYKEPVYKDIIIFGDTE